MAEQERRARGLRSSFPAAYDTRPRGSALGELLVALAAGLTGLDEAIELVLRNRWVRLAQERAPAGAADRLEVERASLAQLGRLVGVVPLPREPLERFRHRMITQARILRQGVTTPRSILALAATALGLDLCGKLDRPAPTDGSLVTVGHAVRAGTVAACGRACGRVHACPFAEAREAQLLLIDNPPDRRARRLTGLTRGAAFHLDNESLEDAEPTLRLSVPKDRPAVAWPSLHHAEETLFYADTLAPGEALIVTPGRAGEDGTVVLIDAAGVVRRLGSGAVVYFTNSARFQDDPPVGETAVRFVEADDDPTAVRFARFGETELRTPLLPAGGTTWSVGQIDRAQLVDMLGAEEAERRFAGAPQEVVAAAFDLEIEWVVYPAATFQLRIPRSAAVREAEAYGALALIHELVELARPAGVAASVDFPQDQELQDSQPAPVDALRAVIEPRIAEPHDAAVALALAVTATIEERPPQDDAALVDGEVAYPLFAGIFADEEMTIGTRFNTSHIAPEED